MKTPTVSVLIPAFNAAATIAETLASVTAQTHRDLDILVVDDGSTDETTELVAHCATSDPRIRLLRQRNLGVAAARNAAAAASRGEFLAPVDADDLWAADKIARQLEIFASRGSGCGLVYSWFALIDAASRIFLRPQGPVEEGSVLRALAYSNFIGNGSSALIRRSAFERTRGYDPTLRQRGGQGCEDWKLYCELADGTEFGVVQDYLTGYRVLRNNMSSDVRQMLRSRDLVASDLLPLHPELARPFRKGRNRMSRFLLHRALRERRFADARFVLASMFKADPVHCAAAIAQLPVKAMSHLRLGSDLEPSEAFL